MSQGGQAQRGAFVRRRGVAGDSGNGPAYVDGPLRVVGCDIYDLDRDGIACNT
jgi:hypothetical protein